MEFDIVWLPAFLNCLFLSRIYAVIYNGFRTGHKDRDLFLVIFGSFLSYWTVDWIEGRQDKRMAKQSSPTVTEPGIFWSHGMFCMFVFFFLNRWPSIYWWHQTELRANSLPVKKFKQSCVYTVTASTFCPIELEEYKYVPCKCVHTFTLPSGWIGIIGNAPNFHLAKSYCYYPTQTFGFMTRYLTNDNPIILSCNLCLELINMLN